MSTTIRTTIYTVQYVRGYSIDAGAPCPQCDDVDAFIVANLYVRAWGETVRFAEACVRCAQRIAAQEAPAEVFVEVPAHLRDEVAGQIENF